LIETQSNKCAICLTEFGEGKKRPGVDHDHACCDTKAKSCGQCVRGLLCGNCNSLLGFVNDDIRILKNAVEYISKYN
jgi:hypothetical protein